MQKKIGLIKPSTDAHTLGINLIAENIKSCGYEVIIGDSYIEKALDEILNENSAQKIISWVKDNGVTVLSISYRLDAFSARDMIGRLIYFLKKYELFFFQGGPLETISFAGLPTSCEIINEEFGELVTTFQGGESLKETLLKLGIPLHNIPEHIISGNEYDEILFKFAQDIIKEEKYLGYNNYNNYNYNLFGTDKDNIIDRLKYSKLYDCGPLIRVHAGPYDSTMSRKEAVYEFIEWCKTLSKSKLLDVLSIGSSQLTQSNFGEDWSGLNNGGGVPINSEIEYFQVYNAAKPMLVRTYSGTKNVKELAQMYEEVINISWHALSFWWFNKLDGRGPNSLLKNLEEHFETLNYIAITGKPFEPNVPHHFSFRGGDDVTYIVSAYLAAKAAKLRGVRSVIIQNMLNTPKNTWGIQDLAKSRALLNLVKTLEDSNFKIYLQTRSGLDYFSPDLEKAKVQLASVTALMDDIEPNNFQSPDIIHVVSYSEASHLATPEVILESIKITKYTLEKYRQMKKNGFSLVSKYEEEIELRRKELLEQAKKVIDAIEEKIHNSYSPRGFYDIFKSGFLPTPYLWGEESKNYPHATKWQTKFFNGGIVVANEFGDIISSEEVISHARKNIKKDK